MELRFPNPALEQALHRVLESVRRAGGRPLLVGGCVRDRLLGRIPHDFDVEVFGISAEKLHDSLSEQFALDVVGRSFGVMKLHGQPIDLSLPRRESKTGKGHKGFDIEADPSISYEQAARRRDFTINSMAYDVERRKLLDPFGGEKDLENRRLRHVSERFSEDPLRVLRGMQFCARFELKADEGTLALCRTLSPEHLPGERLFEEWKKLLLLGVKPSMGMDFLKKSGWLRFFPEIAALDGCPQDAEWHPEGDVFRHTGFCQDAFAKERSGDDAEDLIVGFAVLCHDFGKPATTVFEREHVRSPGHEAAGLEPTRNFMQRLRAGKRLVEAVEPLVQHHLRPTEFYKAKVSDAAIRRLARRVGRIDRLVRVARADSFGRPPIPADDFPEGSWLLERARELDVRDRAPQPLVMGRHLIEMGLKPGPSFKALLDGCYEAQLNGAFATLEDGLEWMKKRLEEERKGKIS